MEKASKYQNEKENSDSSSQPRLKRFKIDIEAFDESSPGLKKLSSRLYASGYIEGEEDPYNRKDKVEEKPKKPKEKKKEVSKVQAVSRPLVVP